MLYAVFEHSEEGWDYDKKLCKELLMEGKTYLVEAIEMDRSSTKIYLKDFPDNFFNSVNFEYYEDGERINIYKNPKYNPFMRGDKMVRKIEVE